MKILIVEDELVSRAKITKLIESLGYETIVAEDGRQGLEMFKQLNPRMVITDWIMPEMDGIDLCRAIRKATGSQYTYLIMVTSKNEVHDIVEGMEAGADDFISKPYIKEELAVRIRAGERILNFESRDVVIFSLAKLAESRDPETGQHLERIRFYSQILAETLRETSDCFPEIDRQFIDNIYLTSPLHDIGKIGIPDFVLLKPGRFDDREFEIMKQHSTIGFTTLNEALKRYPQASYLEMSAEIARSHHEKYDGTGYPDGLAGGDIPLSARIVALADVYDALINRRVYKEPYAHDMVRSMILESNGTHFDPEIVKAFLRSEDKFYAIFEQFKD